MAESLEREEQGLTLMTAEQVAAMLSVPKSWVYEKARQAEIPHVRFGKYIRFQKHEVLAWMESLKAGPKVSI